MRLTVLGKSPSWQDAGGACSGYLVEDGDTVVLLDCGNGVFGKLRRFVDYVDVDAVVISHLHADHFLDLVPFSYGLRYAPRQQPVPVDRWPGTDCPACPTLYAPTGATETFRRVVGAWGPEDLIEGAFDLREYSSKDELEIGSLKVRFNEVPHFAPNTHAVEFCSTNGGGRITYGADHRPSDEIVQFARDTDLLLIEATLPRPERQGDRGHLTPAEAGEHGKRANAKRIVLTHMSDELDALWARDCAERTFDGPVAVAAEGDVYEV
jgi:ribonuclease BN (tRNA processing enzyme)